jgi:hypothetical protein
VKFVITAAVFTSLLAVLLVRSAKPNLPRISRSGCLSSAFPLVSFGNLSANDFVELERHCDFCAVRYRIRLYADGRVEWHGDRGVQAVGDRTARIASSEAQGLIKRFCSSGFWGLCRHYWQMITDSFTYTTTVRIQGRQKQVSDYADSAPGWLRELDDQLDLLADVHRWWHGLPETEEFEYLSVDAVWAKPGVTPLMRAAARDNLFEVKRLLTAGANPNDVDASGWTALMYAAGLAQRNVLAELLRAGAKPDARSLAGQNALMAAAQLSSLDQIGALAAFNNINLQDDKGQTALMLAAHWYWNSDLLKTLLRVGARKDVRDRRNRNACDHLEIAHQQYHESQGYAEASALLCGSR